MTAVVSAPTARLCAAMPGPHPTLNSCAVNFKDEKEFFFGLR